jgi:hypothetical protein
MGYSSRLVPAKRLEKQELDISPEKEMIETHK